MYHYEGDPHVSRSRVFLRCQRLHRARGIPAVDEARSNEAPDARP